MDIIKDLNGESILIYDIETRTFGKPDITKDELRLFGCYSYKYDKTWLLTDKKKIQQVIDNHKFLVGFNNVGTKIAPGYDNPILMRENINLKYKLFIDLCNLFKKRAGVMKTEKGMLGDLLMEFKLGYITEFLDIGSANTKGKEEIDYRLFMKPSWTEDELSKVISYTKQDILITKQLYEWVEIYFWAFREFLNKEDVDKKRYLTISIAKFSYKAICKAMAWEEKYGGDSFDDDGTIGGGYVAFPAGERFEGDIYCLDFSSLYPFIMMMCNIHKRKSYGDVDDDRPVWNGGGVWKTEGIYYADEMGDVGKLIKKWYADRAYFKSIKDRREYTIKILLNAMYGIMDNPYYSLVFDKVGSSDITRIGRQWIHYARKTFRKYGYLNCYTDTDSSYILDHKKDKKEIMRICKEIEDFILSTVPFPQDNFKFKIDDEIEYMYFFKGGEKEKIYPPNEFFEDGDDFINKPKGFMKKNYIYVTKKDPKTNESRVVIKNLGLKKKDRSPLGKKIFWEYLVPKLKQGQVKFTKAYIKELINKLLQEDFSLTLLRRDVGNVEQYKNITSIQAQISAKYGPGLHFLIPNLKGVGVGKGKSFCTMEEFKKHNLKISDIDISNIWKELDYFIKVPKVMNIFDFVKKEETDKVIEK